MRKVFILLLVGWMSAATFGQNSDLETITFMNCVQCDDYFEQEVNIIDVAQLVLSSCAIYETSDSLSIRSLFYNEFPEETLAGVCSVFLIPNSGRIFAIVMRKDVDGETRAMYLLTEHGWIWSVDMQEFYAFDGLLSSMKYSGVNPGLPILKKDELLR